MKQFVFEEFHFDKNYFLRMVFLKVCHTLEVWHTYELRFKNFHLYYKYLLGMVLARMPYFNYMVCIL